VSEFVDECRREWRRLGVPDPVANEMAADLTADLEEAEAEGGSPEDVLGNSAFDPRRFAAAWAVARGVTGTLTPDDRSRWRTPVAIALTIFLGVLTVGAGLLLLAGSGSRSFAVAVRRVAPGAEPIRIFPPGPRFSSGQFVLPFPGTGIAGVNVHPLAFMLLFVGVVGLVLLAVVYRSLWSGLYRSLWSAPRRYRRPGSPRPPYWD
jgi:hypothetical protein